MKKIIMSNDVSEIPIYIAWNISQTMVPVLVENDGIILINRVGFSYKIYKNDPRYEDIMFRLSLQGLI